MRLYEFDYDEEMSSKLSILADQLKTDLEDDEDMSMTVDELLDYAQLNFDLILDITDLYDMIKNPPLDSVIANIQGDDVIFKGQDSSSNIDHESIVDPEKQDQIVSKMAKRAMK